MLACYDEGIVENFDVELALSARKFILVSSDKVGGYADGFLTIYPVRYGRETFNYAMNIAKKYDAEKKISVYSPDDLETLNQVMGELGARGALITKGQFDLYRQYIEIQSDKYKPIPTGIASLDNLIGGGFMRQTLVTLGAAPGAGKTTLAVQILEQMAQSEEGPIDTVYFHIEMSRNQILGHSLARIATKNQMLTPPKKGKYVQIPLGTKELLLSEWGADQKEIMWEARELYDVRIAPYVTYYTMEDDAERYSQIEYICEKVEYEVLRIKATGRKSPLICIDYLQLVSSKEKDMDTIEELKEILLRLKSLAIKYNTTVLVIVAHNRTANKAGIATMESGRDTSGIEYSADLMLSLTYSAVEKGLCTQEVMREILDGGEILIPDYLRNIDSQGNNDLVKKLKSELAQKEYQRLLFEEAKSHADEVCLKVLKGRGVGVGRCYLTFNPQAHLFETDGDFKRLDGPSPFDKR